MQNKFERRERKNFHKECAIHAQLRHPNIIQMLESFETPDYIVVMTELAGIDLHRFLSKYTKKLAELHAQRLGWHLLSALYYLHSHRILHRDLKPQNILLNNYQHVDAMEAKLCDFGLARNMASETYLLTSIKVYVWHVHCRRKTNKASYFDGIVRICGRFRIHFNPI